MGYGVDIGTTAVKVVGVSRGLKGFKVTAAMRRRVPQIGDADPQPVYQKLVRDALGGKNGSRAGVVGLTGRDINLQICQQPNMKPLNYRQMMRYELDQRRGEATDLYMDYCTLREPDQFFPQYLALMGIGKNSYVDGRISILTQNGLDVRDAVPNAFALFAAYRNAYEQEGGTILLLDIGSDNMDMAFVRGGRLIFARNVSNGARVFDTQIANMLGLESMEEAEALKATRGTLGPGSDDDEMSENIHAAIRGAAGQITGVINSSLNYAKLQLQDQGLTIEKIYLSGGGARILGLPEYMQAATKIPVEILDPFQKIDTSAIDKQGGGEEFRRLPTDMAVALGLGQLVSPQPGATTLSIIPENLKKRRNFFRTTLWMGAAGAVLLAVLLVMTGLAWARKSANESERNAFMRDNKSVSDLIDSMNAAEEEQLGLSARQDYLLAHTVPGRGTLEVIQRLRRQPAIVKDKTISIKGLRMVDPTGDQDAQFGNRERAAFLVVGEGLTIGDLDGEFNERDGVKLDGVKDAFTDDQVVGGLRDGVIKYPSVSRALMVIGEVDENIRGGALQAINALRDALKEEKRGTTASVVRQADAEKTGWRRFEILVRFN